MQTLSKECLDAKRSQTETRIKQMASVLLNGLKDEIERKIYMYLENFHTCRDSYIILPNVMQMCRNIMQRSSVTFHQSDYNLIRYMLTFKDLHGAPSLCPDRFAQLGIAMPIIELLDDEYRSCNITLFDVSDPSLSSQIFWKIALDVNKPNKRQRTTQPSPLPSPSYSPTSPGYS
jgi:hypothetical protein